MLLSKWLTNPTPQGEGARLVEDTFKIFIMISKHAYYGIELWWAMSKGCVNGSRGFQRSALHHMLLPWVTHTRVERRWYSYLLELNRYGYLYTEQEVQNYFKIISLKFDPCEMIGLPMSTCTTNNVFSPENQERWVSWRFIQPWLPVSIQGRLRP